MKAQRQRGTQPEIELRSMLHRMGLRFRVHVRLPGLGRRLADLTFSSARVVVFVDGCFWHGCPQHASWPKANAEFGRAKIDGNRQRDVETTKFKSEAGWSVVRVWEHEETTEAATRIATIVRAQRDKASRRNK